MENQILLCPSCSIGYFKENSKECNYCGILLDGLSIGNDEEFIKITLKEYDRLKEIEWIYLKLQK